MAVASPTAATASRAGTLPYAEGGPAQANPAAGLAPESRRYIDAEDGNDDNDGKSSDRPWRSLGTIAAKRASFPPDTHVLLRRGRVWRGDLDFSGVHGADGQRMVLGAYGMPLSARPIVKGTVQASNSSHLTIRDFDCIKIDVSGEANQVLVFDNVVHGCAEADEWPSNGIRVFGPAHHIAIVQNLVYDLRANDCIAIHPNGGKIGVRNAFWIVDNVCIGNSGMEDGIDLAMSQPEDGNDSVVGRDVKVIGNRIQAQALAGLSARSGRGGKCLSAGHQGTHLWIIGNTMGGSQHIGVNLGSQKRGVQVSGNVIFNCANNQVKTTSELLAQELRAEHNTIVHAMPNRAAVKLPAAIGSFVYNLALRTVPGGQWVEIAPGPAERANAAMDHNWFGYAENPTLDGKPWSVWRETMGLDLHSTAGGVPGVTAPAASQFNDDPRNWRDQAFLKHFVPQPDWAGCAGENTPGAFDCHGRRLGATLRPFPDLAENQGYGWEGPPIVRLRYPLPNAGRPAAK